MEDQGTYAFTANIVGSEEADEALTVGVAEEFGPYFMIQRPLGCDEVQSEDLYTEFGDQVNGDYGTLELLTVGRNRLIAKLNGGRRVEATLEISDESFAALEEDLRRCFSGLENLLCLRPKCRTIRGSQRVISFSISLQPPFSRARWSASDVRLRNES